MSPTLKTSENKQYNSVNLSHFCRMVAPVVVCSKLKVVQSGRMVKISKVIKLNMF